MFRKIRAGYRPVLRLLKILFVGLHPPTGKDPNNGTVRQSKNGLTVLTRDS